MFPLLSPPIVLSHCFYQTIFPISIDQFELYFHPTSFSNKIEQNYSSIEDISPDKKTISQYFVEENKCFPFSESKNILKNEFENQAIKFFIETMNAVPRPALIRNLLLMMFPKGINNLSIRKITRTPSKDLLSMIGENIHLIHSRFSDKIKHQWFETCYNKLKDAKRQQKNDSIIFQFMKNYFQDCS
jgi:hypothetical protein